MHSVRPGRSCISACHSSIVFGISVSVGTSTTTSTMPVASCPSPPRDKHPSCTSASTTRAPSRAFPIPLANSTVARVPVSRRFSKITAVASSCTSVFLTTTPLSYPSPRSASLTVDSRSPESPSPSDPNPSMLSSGTLLMSSSSSSVAFRTCASVSVHTSPPLTEYFSGSRAPMGCFRTLTRRTRGSPTDGDGKIRERR